MIVDITIAAAANGPIAPGNLLNIPKNPLPNLPKLKNTLVIPLLTLVRNGSPAFWNLKNPSVNGLKKDPAAFSTPSPKPGNFSPNDAIEAPTANKVNPNPPRASIIVPKIPLVSFLRYSFVVLRV